MTQNRTLRRVQASPTRLAWYEFTGEPLSSHSGFKHAMLTRLGGVSRGAYASLNLGGTVGDRPEDVYKNHDKVYETLGIAAGQVVSPEQVHQDGVARVTLAHGGTVIPKTDALITDEAYVVMLLRFADCVPVLFYDPVHHAAGLAHAGWRGVAAEVVPATVQAMVDAFGTKPEALWAGIGPCIGIDHYCVGEEVVTAIQSTLPVGVNITEQREGQWAIDLASAVEAQLNVAGVEQVGKADLCTACHTEEWYSHRGEQGKTGRFGVVVMLA